MPGLTASSRWPLSWAIVWIAIIGVLAPVVAEAARPVRVYEVTVKGPDSITQLQDAMRQALVRATGKRGAASDPALSQIIADAPKYVQGRKPVQGGTQIAFDGAAIEKAIVAAGRTVWARERPFTVVVLNPPLSGTAADSARRTLEEVGEARGLPVSLVPLTLTDSTGAELPREVVLQTAQRMGADAVLIGRSDNATVNGQWQWTLQTSSGTESWTGAFDAGVHGAVDALGKVEEATASLPESEAVIEVEGISTLTDYASVTRLLGEVPGVKRASLDEANRSSATFRVVVRGGGETLDRALQNSARLVRSGGAGTRLIYQYRP